MEKDVFSQFETKGALVRCVRYGDGHINRTYLAESDTGNRYILQCISAAAFHDVPGLMKNIISVTKHIAAKSSQKDCTLHFLPVKGNSEYVYTDPNGENWRCYDFVDAMCIQKAETPEDFYQSAVAFGTFQNQLSDFPASTLIETIPNFHNTPVRYQAFKEAIQKDVCQRAAGVKEEIDFYLSREAEGGKLQTMRESGELPLRVTHNDTKLNNVLLDKATRKAVCVIDLDTVMPGLSAYDFGDSIRFGAATAAEDELNLEMMHLDLNLFRIFSEGFISSCHGLTEKEIAVLPLGAKIMTLECGMRFLTDYLEGDRYFHISRPTHNLDRARTQIQLIKDMENKWGEMNRIAFAAYRSEFCNV